MPAIGRASRPTGHARPMKHFRFNPIVQRERCAARSQGRTAADHLVDAMLDVYVRWREECLTVAWAYESWAGAQWQDKALAFDAYVAALEREQLAAASYRRFAEAVSRA